jgi:RND family efflux transporter MFP subunit
MRSIPKSIAALAAGSLLLLRAAAAAQNGDSQAPADGQSQGYQRLVLPDLARIDWIEKSAVAALREGVIEKMELKIGMPVKAGGTIGYLHRRFAELTVEKAKRQAESIGPLEKAGAQEEVALSVVALDRRLNGRRPGLVAAEEVAKHEGELKVASAQIKEADENQKIAHAEQDLAQQTLDEHTIKAPFDGIITKRMKNPGESVRANEAVVELGNLNRLAADCYVPIEYSYRVKEGQVVELQPRSKSRTPLPIERKRFRGKITFVDPEIQPIGETAVRIRAEFENPGRELRPGLEGQMTIFLPPEERTRGSGGGWGQDPKVGSDRRIGPREAPLIPIDDRGNRLRSDPTPVILSDPLPDASVPGREGTRPSAGRT